jgi:hypothetical protein
MTAYFGVTPLAPAYVLLSGAVLVLLLGPSITPSHRYWLRVAVCAASLIALALVDITAVSGGWRESQVYALIQWADGPAIALQSVPFHPFRWGLFLSLLAIAAATRASSTPFLLTGQTMILVFATAAFGVLSAGSYRTLAVAVVLFDGVAALGWSLHRQPNRAIGQLVLAVVTGTAVTTMASSLDNDLFAAGGLRGDLLFSLAVWLRVGLYPLFEAGNPTIMARPTRQAWHVINLIVGLHLIAIGTVPEVVWPALIVALLHGALAWIETRREQAFAHAAWALAGTVLASAALGVNSLAVIASSVATFAGWLVLTLTASPTPPSQDQGPTPHWQSLWAYVPLTLATLSWLGLPFTVGWFGRASFMQLIWDTRGPQMLALAAVTCGAAVSVIYRLWQTWVQRQAVGLSPERLGGATLATVPFLIPVVGLWFVSLIGRDTLDPLALGSYGVGAWVGLGGVLLWAAFLGYSRDWLAWLDPSLRKLILRRLRLGWLAQCAEWLGEPVCRVLLRLRSIGEGEHYLAWALLTALCIGLWLVFDGLVRGS